MRAYESSFYHLQFIIGTGAKNSAFLTSKSNNRFEPFKEIKAKLNNYILFPSYIIDGKKNLYETSINVDSREGNEKEEFIPEDNAWERINRKWVRMEH